MTEPRYAVRTRSPLDPKYRFAVDDTFRHEMIHVFETEAAAAAYARKRNKEWRKFMSV